MGVGYYPVEPGIGPYGAAYFDKYVAYAETPLGQSLNASRMAFVARHWKGPVVDVGIGCGSFVEARPFTSGFDVNPFAVRWLMDRRLFTDPFATRCEAVTMWDVMEHIHDFPDLLDQVQSWVWLSLPIFNGPDDVLASKHFRTDEHCWYFTVHGLISVMLRSGFRLVEQNRAETFLGRESIGSFAFKRVARGL